MNLAFGSFSTVYSQSRTAHSCQSMLYSPLEPCIKISSIVFETETHFDRNTQNHEELFPEKFLHEFLSAVNLPRPCDMVL